MKKRINNPVWCILHAVYLLRFVFVYSTLLYMFLWMVYALSAGVGC